MCQKHIDRIQEAIDYVAERGHGDVSKLVEWDDLNCALGEIERLRLELSTTKKLLDGEACR